MLADVLRNYVKGDTVGRMDFRTLEQVRSERAAQVLKRLPDDALWRVRCDDGKWVLAYVALESRGARALSAIRGAARASLAAAGPRGGLGARPRGDSGYLRSPSARTLRGRAVLGLGGAPASITAAWPAGSCRRRRGFGRDGQGQGSEGGGSGNVRVGHQCLAGVDGQC